MHKFCACFLLLLKYTLIHHIIEEYGGGGWKMSNFVDIEDKDDLRRGDYGKNKGNCKNEDDLKNEDNLKNKDT